MRSALLLFASSVLGIFCLAKGTWPPACTINPCKNGGICIPSSVGWKCRCVGPYTGMTCETVINACLSNPCLGGGTCAVGSQNRHWYCICPPGKTGLRCDKVIHDCSSQPCQNGGSCCENQSGYTCDCKPGFTGNYCETDIDECLSEPCQNGGTCVDQVNGYSCSCRVGLEGRHCERKKPGCHSNTCLNGGSCAESSDWMWYCICPKTYKGIQCDQQVNDCSSHPCQNGGSCCDKGDHYECTCPDVFTGRHCETKLIVPSSTSSVIPSSSGCICYNEGVCMGNGICSCIVPWYGPHCELEEYCPCQNGGTCYSYPPHASCACKYPFTGQYCETHYCDIQEPCHNGGTCVKIPNAFKCICPMPFTGLQCNQVISTLPISSSSAFATISSSSTRTVSPSSSACDCVPGHGSCVIGPSQSASCACFSLAYYGPRCEFEHDPCTRGYCGTTGWCSKISPDQYTCIYSSGAVLTSTHALTSTPTTTVTALTSTPPLTSTSFVTTCDCVPGHGRCIIRSSLSPSCSCIATGYFGSRCEFEHDPCTNNHCGSTASCLKLAPDVFTCVTSFVATTPTPTLSSSSSVATITPTSTLTTSSTSTVTVIYDHICDISRPCGQYGQCIKIQTPPGYRCQCYPGYIGQHCESSLGYSTTSSISSSTTVRITTTERTRGFQTTILTTRSSSLSTVSSSSMISKRSRRHIRKNVEITEVEDDELKRICKINERKARKLFSNNQPDKKNWEKLHPGIKAVLVDLVANNDHQRLSGTHAQIKDAVAGNDLKEMSRIMSERSLWKRVPVARYWKRKQMMKKAAKSPWSSLVKSEVVC